MSRIFVIVALMSAAFGCMADPVTKTRLGSLNPREGLVVTDVDLSGIGGGDPVQEIARFAATGSVARAATYGTPTRWTDATGCVWEVVIDLRWDIVYKDPVYGPQYAIHIEPSGLGNGRYWEPYCGEYSSGMAKGDEDSTVLEWDDEAITDFTATRTVCVNTNLVGRVAYTNDITTAIREQSLGGIWDGEVWWTPVMLPGGCLTYQATTNVNLSAEGNE